MSAEIIVITLGVVSAQKLMTQLGVLATVSILMTLGVYGLVAGIVKLDDLGLHLVQKTGYGLLIFAPWLMRGLSVFGTLAMFMAGGGIIYHHPRHCFFSSCQSNHYGPAEPSIYLLFKLNITDYVYWDYCWRLSLNGGHALS